jgi:hypothetical protein
MTLNVTVASPRFVICTTDRRLICRNGKIGTEQSTKLTSLMCRDALALIAYNGIGRLGDKTPADWILELEEKAKLTSLRFKEVLQLLRTDVETRIRTVPRGYDRRHTFVIGACGRGRTWLCAISNYEEALSEETEKVARGDFVITCVPQLAGRETRVLVTGCTNDVDRRDCRLVSRVAEGLEPQVSTSRICV